MSWRNDVVTSPYGRSACPVCGREFNLTKKGVMRVHGDGYAFPPMNCRGSGKAPKEA